MPRSQSNVTTLRDRFAQILGDQKGYFSGTTIPALLTRLGLNSCLNASSNREQLSGAVHASDDDQVISAARMALVSLRLAAHERFELQDLVWDDGSTVVINTRFRHEVAKSLNDVDLCFEREGFFVSLEELWHIDDVQFLQLFQYAPSLRDLIEKHYVDNSDWNALRLFEKLGAFKCSDARFARFLEVLASSKVRPDEDAQRLFMSVVDRALQPCGVHFRVNAAEDGYLSGTLSYVSGSAKGSPKNLIFASSQKPDLRLGNALDNDVEVVTRTDSLLIYDRPIGRTGLLWEELQSWYEHSNGLGIGEGKAPLYQRLLACLPESSPVQRLAFMTFYRTFASDVPKLPVLLPEVWFHWDPQTVAQRGKAALLRSRMDFLLLLPGGRRVVIEVDGRHHYATEDGYASPERYSAMMAADRSLRLDGYEVFRFGGHELGSEHGEKLLSDFYRSLFKMYSLVH